MNEWTNNIPGTVAVPNYAGVYYQPIFKNAHSTLMNIFEAPTILPFFGKAKSISSNTFVVLRHPIDRWVSAMNMHLRSDWRKKDRIPEAPDAHMMPQVIWLEKCGYVLDNLRYYDMNQRGFLKHMFKAEKLYRYIDRKNDHLNKKSKYFGPAIIWDGSIKRDSLRNIAESFLFLKEKDRDPTVHFLHHTPAETMNNLLDIYERDIEFYESRNFINR